MIDSFASSWALFHNAYVGGWLISVLLALLGVLVVARDQIFVGAAVSQASMLGITVGMWLASGALLGPCDWCASDAFLSLSGGVFAVLGALLTANRGGPGGESREAVTGWIFLLGASLSVLLVAHSPHGLEEVHRLLSSTLIGATATDVAVLALLVALTVLVVLRAARALILLVIDPEMARAVGVPVTMWDRLLSVALGFFVALSIRVSGVTYTFGCLVLPALIAKNVCREVRAMFVVAPLVALATTVVAFVVANHHDLPPGQTAVALLGVATAGAWVARGIGARRRAGASGAP